MTTTANLPASIADLSGTYVIDPAHSRIGFVARHAMVTKVRGGFNEFEGHGRRRRRRLLPLHGHR